MVPFENTKSVMMFLAGVWPFFFLKLADLSKRVMKLRQLIKYESVCYLCVDRKPIEKVRVPMPSEIY